MSMRPLFGVVLTLLFAANALAEPQEKTQAVINRTLNDGNSVRTELSLNVLKKESYQAEYDVQVPYDEQETYYEDVPYQAEESYYEDVPYTERIPYTDYEDYYDREYVCNNVTRYRQECRTEHVCAPPREICKIVRDCSTDSGGIQHCTPRNECEEQPPQCHDRQRCHEVPYQDQECGYQTVLKNRPVTRYREETRYTQELRTRTVTKYRQEERTRTVTKYRTETRCCVTKYRDVFDHQFTQPVSVIFPGGSELFANESEIIQAQLRGNESNPNVSINVKSNIFQYEIDQTREEGREKVFVLKLIPKWSKQNAGTNTVQNFKLSFINGSGIISFKETVASKRMTSVYTLEVRDYQSQALVLQQQMEGAAAKVFEVPASKLLRQGKYTMRLHVEHRGVNVAGGSLNFDQTSTYEKITLDQNEIKKLRSADQVQLISLDGTGANRVLLFKDLTPALDEIKTTYKLVIWQRNSDGEIESLGEKSFSRDQIARSENELAITLKEINANLPAQKYLYILAVNRTSSVYLGDENVQFVVNKNF